MLAAVITLSALMVGFLVLLGFMAREIHKGHDQLLRSMESGEALLKSNFELQAEMRQWKSAHEDVTHALADKNEELDRAVAARKVLEHRHSDLVLRMTEGAPLDDLTEELQSDLDKVRQLSIPSPSVKQPDRLPLPLPAPPKERDTPVERPTAPKTGGDK